MLYIHMHVYMHINIYKYDLCWVYWLQEATAFYPPEIFLISLLFEKLWVFHYSSLLIAFIITEK